MPKAGPPGPKSRAPARQVAASRRRQGQERRLHQRRDRGRQSGPDARASAASGSRGRPGSSSGAAEHPCVLNGHRFPADAVELIPVDPNGILDLAWLEARLEQAGDERVLVSVQLANNETGVLQPVAEAARLVHAHGGLVHTDAVQAAGRIPVDIAELGVDALTLSAHKIGGPKGVGAVILASDQFEIADRLIRGGGQEKGYRAGTENVAAIAGFGAAAELALAGPGAGSRHGSGRSATRRRPSFAGSRPMRLLWRAALSGCRIPSPLPYPASRPRRR